MEYCTTYSILHKETLGSEASVRTQILVLQGPLVSLCSKGRCLADAGLYNVLSYH